MRAARPKTQDLAFEMEEKGNCTLEGTISRLLLERRFQHTSLCPEHRVVLLLKR